MNMNMMNILLAHYDLKTQNVYASNNYNKVKKILDIRAAGYSEFFVVNKLNILEFLHCLEINFFCVKLHSG